MSPSSKRHIAWGQSFLRDATCHLKHLYFPQISYFMISIKVYQNPSPNPFLFGFVAFKTQNKNNDLHFQCMGATSRDFDQPFTVRRLTFLGGTVDGRYPANPVEGKVVYPIIYRVLAPSQVVVWDFFHQRYPSSEFDEIRLKKAAQSSTQSIVQLTAAPTSFPK